MMMRMTSPRRKMTSPKKTHRTEKHRSPKSKMKRNLSK
jgi:hypothetical protein